MRNLLRPVMTVAIVLSLSQLSLSPSLAKENWVLVSENEEYRQSINANSLVRQGNLIWFWWHVQYKTNRQPNERQPAERLRYASADCSQKIIQIHRALDYNAQGEQISEKEYGDAIFPVRPDFPILRYVCARR